MKWTQGAFVLIFLCFLGYITFVLYPIVHPIIAHLPKHGWLTLLVTQLFFSHLDIFPGVTPYVILSFMVTLVLIAQIDIWMRKSTKHGSAHPATRHEARPFRRSQPVFSRPSQPQRGLQVQIEPREVPSQLVLGKYRGSVIALSEKQQESNATLTAPVGAGKSARVIIPNLLMEHGNRSLFISDVKGELVRKTAGAVSRFHEVWVFAPMRPQQSEGYNPLAHIRTIEDAQAFSRCWVANTGKSDDEFWTNAARRLMTATLLHVRTAEPHAPFSRVAEILVEMKYDQMKHILLTSPSNRARKEVTAFFDYMDKNPKLVGSLMADIGTHFQLLVSDSIRAVTAHNEIDFRAMTERPIALYLSIPTRYAEEYQPLLACFMMQMFSSWEACAEETATGQLPRHIMCYLDEFANLGYIPNMSSYVSTARHTGVGLLIVLQSFSQVVAKYGKATLDNILVNTVTHLLLPGAGLEETKYYSERIGNTTIQTETRTSRGSDLFGMNSQDSWSQGETSRRLMMPDELRTMPANNMLMLSAASAPLILETKPYFEDRRLASLAELPFTPVRIYQEPPVSSSQPLGSSPGFPTPPLHQPQVIVDSNQKEAQGNDQFFLQE